MRLVASVTSVVACAAAATVLAPIRPAGAASGIGTDQARLRQLEARIAAEGARVQALVTSSAAQSARLATIRTEIGGARVLLAHDRRAEHQATLDLRRVAVATYVDAVSGGSSGLDSLNGRSSASALPAQQVYMKVASGGLDAFTATLQGDQVRTGQAEQVLLAKEAQTAAVLSQLDATRQAAQAAVQADDTTLNQVQGNLVALVLAANQRRQAAQAKAEEQALAAAAAQRQAQQRAAAAPAPAATVTVNASPGSYANPLRAVRGLTSDRVDQGVDYSGYGPIYALGDATVLSTYNGGWPGGAFLAYRLTDGPGAGLVVYAAEDINPSVQIGQSVNANTVIGQIYAGPDGIETGWANPAADGETMAATYAQYGGANSTSFGANFSALLQSLGAPGGILQNTPPSGAVPSGWPQW